MAHIFCSLLGFGAMFAAGPAAAQTRPAPATASAGDTQEEQLPVLQQQAPLDVNQTGRTASSVVGEVGQRQTRESASSQAGIEPMARISSRIQNRVQNRIRNRIDRNYTPQSNATDPFAAADDQAKSGGRPR